jgi:hypothetical protein
MTPLHDHGETNDTALTVYAAVSATYSKVSDRATVCYDCSGVVRVQFIAMVRTAGGKLLRKDVAPILPSLLDIHRNWYVCLESLSMCLWRPLLLS